MEEQPDTATMASEKACRSPTSITPRRQVETPHADEQSHHQSHASGNATPISTHPVPRCGEWSGWVVSRIIRTGNHDTCT